VAGLLGFFFFAASAGNARHSVKAMVEATNNSYRMRMSDLTVCAGVCGNSAGAARSLHGENNTGQGLKFAAPINSA
jgi:hypothetical protein